MDRQIPSVPVERDSRSDGLYSAYRAISEIFFALFRINVQKNTYTTIKTAPTVQRFMLPDSDCYDRNAERIMRGVSSKRSCEAALRFIDRSTLDARMADRSHIMTDFVSYAGDSCRLHFFREDEAADGSLCHVIFGVEKIDEEISSAVINALSREYRNVFWINLRSGTSRVLKMDGYIGEGIDEKQNRVFSYAPVCEQYIATRIHPDDREEQSSLITLEHLRAHFRSSDELTGSYRLLIDGQVHHYTYVYSKLDNLDCVVAAFRNVDDVIARHRNEEQQELERQEQLAQALAAAQQASRAKSVFLNSMSHDIRTPMNAIIGFTALAQAHIHEPEQVQDYLAKISTSGTHLLSLINDILDMSRIESGTVELDEKPLHLPDLLHDLRTMIQGLVSAKNLNLYIDTQDVIHEDVIADRLRLNQVLINLVSNAIKFTGAGGDIMIRLLEQPCQTKRRASYVFSVKDNGIGMSKEFQSHIFESFTREHSTTVSGIQGSGLGMAITKNIIDMMGGEITVLSEEGHGSLFTVTLQLQRADTAVRNEPIPELLGARVLVVDDDLDTCRSISKMLRTIQMRPDWTSSGREAVIRAQDASEAGDSYRVYIIDYLMPDMNGIEVVRRIRRVIPEDVPIIVLTAYDWSDFEAEAREAGVTAFVSKPLFLSELRRVLTRPEEYAEQSGSEPRHYDYHGRHVLLVEDNELNREIATEILEEAGLRVDTAADGTEAVDILYRADEDEYDLIFMDIQMPKMDGYTATYEIRTLAGNKKANIPIVAMTANAFEEDRKKSFAAGMNAHITKPVSIEEIAKVLDTIFTD